MYLQTLAPAWRDLYYRLIAQTTALVVDESAGARRTLEELFGNLGYRVECVETLDAAWERVNEQRFDLAIVDDLLPDGDGTTLIRRIRDDRLEVPCVVSSTTPTTELISTALAAGASDYLTKPYSDLLHVAARVRPLIDRRATTILFDILIRDLSELCRAGEMDDAGYASLSAELFAFKLSLNQRAQVIICDDAEFEAAALRYKLEQLNVSAEIARSPEALFASVRNEQPPLAVVLALEIPNSLHTLRRLRRETPHIELLVTAEDSAVAEATAAIDAGASDYVLRVQDGAGALGERIRRLVQRSRRHHLYLHLAATLRRAPTRLLPNIADDLVFARDENDVAYIRTVRPLTEGPADAPACFSLEEDFAEGRLIGDPLSTGPLRTKAGGV